ncbi:MAG: type II toxin-antitoxin system RelE/ParE family toxin [bacterium]
MIQEFADEGTEDIYNNDNTKKARQTCPKELWRTAQKKFTFLNTAQELNDLRVLPGNQLESLSGNRKGQYSIRINDQYRICFRWTDIGPTDVEIIDYHD